MMYDAAIVGAGPAGATLARLIGKRLKVLLLDRRRLDCGGPCGACGEGPGPGPGKCCGGLVAPDAQRALAAMGLGLPASVLVGPQLFAVRAVDLPSGLQRIYQRHYINIDRAAFDRWLLSLISPRVDVRGGCAFKGFRKLDGGFEIRLLAGGRTCAERARVLIGADGAGSLVRRQAAPTRPRPARYLAIQETFRQLRPLPYFSAYFDPSITDYYAWSIPKADHLLVGVALPIQKEPAAGPDGDATPRATFEALKAKLRSAGTVLGACVGRSAGLILRPHRVDQLCPAADGVVLVGEAAGWISPSSAEGLSYAFRSALAAAAALRAGPAGLARRYEANTRWLRWNILAKSVKSRLIYSPGVRRRLLRSGVGCLHLREARGPSPRLRPLAIRPGDIL